MLQERKMKETNERPLDYPSIIKKIWNYQTDEPTIDYTESLKYLKLKEIIDVLSIGNYFVYVVNLHSGNFEYISPSIQSVLGYSANEFDLAFYVELIHPNDLPHLIQIQEKVTAYTLEKDSSERMDYKYCYDFRVKDCDGNYRQLYIQHFYSELSEHNRPQRAFSLLTDITHLKKGGIPTLNIFKLGDGLVKILNNKEDNKLSMTNKESEIFEFLVKGYTSKDIAEALGISKHTVDTHRRNILKRNNCSNTSELLSLYFESTIE